MAQPAAAALSVMSGVPVKSLKKVSLTAVFHDNRKQRLRQGRRIALVGKMWYLR